MSAVTIFFPDLFSGVDHLLPFLSQEAETEKKTLATILTNPRCVFSVPGGRGINRLAE